MALTATLAGCVPERPAVDSVDDPWARDDARLDSLGATDRAGDAIAIAERRLRLVRTGLQPSWRAREAAVSAREWRTRERAAPDVRAALASADRALLDAAEYKRADSLGAARERAAFACTTRDSLLGSGSLAACRAALVLADLEFLLSHPGEADSVAEAAANALRPLVGPEHPLVADALEVQGRVVKNFGGPTFLSHALTHYDPALRMRVRTCGPGGAPVAVSLQSLGNLYRLARQPRTAVAFMHRALEIRRARLTLPHDELASILSGMAFIHMGLGEWNEAERLSREAIEASPPSTPPGSISVRLGVHGQMLRRLGRESEAVRDLRAAVAIRESVWARTPRDEGTTLSSGLSLYRDLAMALASQGRAEEAFEQFERGNGRALLLRIGADSAGVDPWRDLLARVQAALPHDAALVAWLRTPSLTSAAEPATGACVVRSTGPPRWVALHQALVGPGVRGNYRDLLFVELRSTAGWPLRVPGSGAVKRYARGMGREVFAPLEPLLEGATRLIVCSPDLFGGGPLGALEDEQGRWLADRYDITYTPSALLWLAARSRGETTQPSALLVGDPAYPEPSGLQPLTSSAQEIAAIAELLPHASRLTGAAATASRLRALAQSGELGRYQVLHVSAHTAIDTRRVLDSALLLAPESGGGFAPSRLLAREVIGWKLGADLVCLAGCGSATGMSSASEGQLGLQTAFLSAGARALLVTLWPVDDHAAALLMERFYRHLAAGGARDHARALREAQAELRAWTAADGSHPYAHPAYWSAFALVGDPGWR
ncbi:MAG: CHAT domain-containing protein [Candidatus Eisenbacteria bacterium]|uniref:CHAT domain-containing protein n=1 Tax=Eiseniibacteriota bacterium TaxID=2212470 RepID=A0A933W231_UNCEI|nr:CHAT domain-containing protein [Candidatus Eisenbacteria bacterium]